MKVRSQDESLSRIARLEQREALGAESAIELLRDEVVARSVRGSLQRKNDTRRLGAFALVILVVLLGSMKIKYPSDATWIFLAISFLAFALLVGVLCGALSKGEAMSSQTDALFQRFVAQVSQTKRPAAAGAILDLLALPLAPGDRNALLPALARLLKLADDETARGLAPAQLQTLARLVLPLDAPELAISGLLTLASARYSDRELLGKTSSLALTDAPLGLAAREYRRAVQKES